VAERRTLLSLLTRPASSLVVVELGARPHAGVALLLITTTDRRVLPARHIAAASAFTA